MNEYQLTDTSSVTSREGPLEQSGLSRKIIPLKNGAQIEAGLGIAWLEILRGLLEKHPEHFEALLANVTRQEQMDPKHKKFLRHSGIISAKEEVDSELRDVLISAYQNPSGEGHVLTNPFKFNNEHDAHEIEKLMEGRYLSLFTFLTRKGKKEQGDGPAP